MFPYLKKVKRDFPDLFIFSKRLFIFFILFIGVTGTIGPWVVGTRLLYDFHFFIYGNLGKLVLLSVIIFLFLIKDRFKKTRVPRYGKFSLLFLVGGLILIPLFFWIGKLLLGYDSFNDNVALSILGHVVLVGIPVLLAFGVFGIGFIRRIFTQFKKEILICVGISIVLFVAIFQVWKLWPYFSGMVLEAEHFLFSRIFENVTVIPPRGLFVEKFAVDIGEACSGLESIFMFTVLYIFMVYMDRTKMNMRKVVLAYPLLFAGLVVVNILRVFILILVGVIWSPELMADLFHTYLGMVLFIVYFLVFLKWGYERLIQKSKIR